VASGEAPLSLGSDTGGSVRCPASFCGVVGLKPTYGLVSRYGLIAYANSLEQIGPIAPDVRGIAILLDVISGIDERDSTLFPGKRGNYLSYQEEPGKIRIGVPKEFMQGIDQSVEKVIWRSIHRFEELGAEYEEMNLEMTKYALASYYIIAMSEASSNLARYDGLRYGFRVKDKDWTASFSSTRGKGFGEEVKRRILLGTYALSAGYYGRYYLKALRVRNLIKMEFERVFKKFDVLLTPTMPFVAFRLGEKIHDPLSLYLADVNTVSVNLAGVPAISLPCGRVDGLPVGLQIIGKHWDEERILRIAYLFEKDGYNNRS
jgi:aspartyl-tRNA(Asn)/glutamyl-tRNA(Gln) amidotransferase subunit A